MVIDQILNCDIQGLMKRPYLAAKVTELFILQLHELTQPQASARLELLSQQDITALNHAKVYLEKHFKEGCTILKLSKIVGLNRLKLKTGFKLAYSETIFEYLTKVRMREAEHLLKNTSLSISDIANCVGYKHSQHFAKAFKKQYGVTPKNSRN